MDVEPRVTVPTPRRAAARPGIAVRALAAVAAAALAAALAAAVVLRVAAAGDLGTDRDAFTPSPSVVAPGTVFSVGSFVSIDNAVGLPTNYYPEYLARIGQSERFEWRFGVNYGVGCRATW